MKSQIMHIHNHQRPRCTLDLYCGEKKLEYVDSYKYLGVLFAECLTVKPAVQALTSADSKSFGHIVHMFKKLNIMDIRTYETLYNSIRAPVMNCKAEIWGCKE